MQTQFELSAYIEKLVYNANINENIKSRLCGILYLHTDGFLASNHLFVFLLRSWARSRAAIRDSAQTAMGDQIKRRISAELRFTFYTFLIRYARFVQRRRRNRKNVHCFSCDRCAGICSSQAYASPSLTGNVIWLRSELKNSHIMYF